MHQEEEERRTKKKNESSSSAFCFFLDLGQIPLPIIISYLDTAANANSLLPLLVDLDLTVLSKPGYLVHGNYYLNGL
jgi:hypothetical protein